MRILWVTAEVPDRERGGGSIRQAHLLEALSRRADVHLVVGGTIIDDRVPAAATITQIQVPAVLPPATKLARRARDLWRASVARSPAEVLSSRPAVRALRRVLPDPSAFDVVSVEHTGLAPLLPRRRRGPWSLNVQNIPSRMAEQQRLVTDGRRQRWLLDRERRKAERFEGSMYASYDLVVAVSPEDAARLGSGAVVVPNGVDLVQFRPTPIPGRPRVVFTGTLSYLPNVDGILWFCREVMPLLHQRIPDLELDIVGRQPVAEVRALARQRGVRVHADVTTVASYLTGARVAVVPLRVGTGTRLKVLEAMAAGRPVVGTTIGLEGLHAVAGRHAVVADDAATMAATICALCEDDGWAASLASEARSFVESRYSWDAIGDAYADVLESVAVKWSGARSTTD